MTHSLAPWTVSASNHWSIRSADHKTVAEIVSQLPTEMEANADVMAASPDMLKIIKALDEWYRESGGSGPSASALLFEDDRPLEEHIKAAIVKAEAYKRP